MKINLEDRTFYHNKRAIHVVGYADDAWMEEFGGVGPSPTQYSMKAVLIDGDVFIPSQASEHRSWEAKKSGIMKNFPMVKAKVQPPKRAIKSVEPRKPTL